MSSETKICQNCKNNFTIEPEDFKFYEKIKVPPPTWCPECRAQRRMTWRNERALYKRKDANGIDVISIYSEDKPVKIYERNYWWSDKWNPMDFGKDYDFSKPLFIQFRELFESVPAASIFNSNPVNSDYCNHSGYMKNCYLTPASWECERVSYSARTINSKDSIDLMAVFKCELCYEAIDSSESYKTFFSQNCSACFESYFLFDCKNCNNCFGCVGLRNKQYYIFNQPYTKEGYKKRIENFDIGSYKKFNDFKKTFLTHKLSFPFKFARLINTVNVIGNNLLNAKNSKYCFDMREMEECRYLTHGFEIKDSFDGFGIGLCELLYEGIDTGEKGASKERFSVVVYASSDTHYCFNCEGSSSLFACIGLRNKSYCILNKQYTKEEYEKLVPKIIEHMNSMPYIDKRGRVYKYGEFFPPELSPFSYNETIAQEYFPLTKDQALDKGYSWKDPEPRNYEITLKTEDLPDHIKDVPDSILNEIIQCAHFGHAMSKCNEQCTEAYKIIPQELQFLRKMNLPLPRLCPNCRHYQRIKQRNPLKLWHRKCQCAGATSHPSTSSGYSYRNTADHIHHKKEEPCPNEFETTYAPERPEIVYCEACYLREVV